MALDAAAADLIFEHGVIMPMDGTLARSGAVAIKGERILWVGSDDEVREVAGPRTERVDLGGRMVLPGLTDTHVHLAGAAAGSLAVDVRDFYDPAIRSVRDIQARIREQVARTPAGQWIVARGSPLQEGRLPVRVQLLVRVIESSFSKESLLDLGFLDGLGSDWLRLGGIKMSIDGGITGKNAAFSDPLVHDGEEQPGLIRIEQDELDDTVARYHRMGMRCSIHAIGDVAMDMALEALDKAISAAPRKDHRHRVEHLGNWMITPERLERIMRLSILPVPNPGFLYFMGGELLDLLGPRRTAHGFPFRTLMGAGVPLTFGSDAPGFYPVDPLRDLGAAVSRGTIQGPRLAPEEAISMYQALWTQTGGAAYAGFQERQLGTLRPGNLADMVVLEEDPLRFPADRFRELPVYLTMTGGRVVDSAQPEGAAAQAPSRAEPLPADIACACPY